MNKDPSPTPDEFDTFLQQSSEEDQKRLEAEMTLNELNVRFREELKKHGWTSLNDDADRRGSLYEQFIKMETDSIDERERHDEGRTHFITPDEEASLIRDSAEQELELAIINEQTQLDYVTVMWGMINVMQSRVADLPDASEKIRGLKVTLYARLRVSDGLPADSPIIKAANKLVPGGEIHDDDAAEEMVLAQESLESKDKNFDKLLNTINQAYAATDISVYEDSETITRMMTVVEKITSVVSIFSIGKEPSDPSWQAEREAKIREMGNELGLKGLYINQLVKYFEANSGE